jgi:hypothetical protein
MSLEDGQDIDFILLDKIYNSVISMNQFSDSGIGHFGNASAPSAIYGKRFTFFDERFDEFFRPLRIIPGNINLDFQEPLQRLDRPYDFRQSSFLFAAFFQLDFQIFGA